MNDNEKYIEEFVRDIPFDAPDEKHRDELKEQLLNTFPKHRLQPTDRTVQLRRFIMNKPLLKLAAAAVIIVAVLIGINPFGGSVTFAQVIQPILSARTVIFDFIVGEDQTGPVIHDTVVGPRIRRTISNIPNMVSVIDLDSAKILALDTVAKTATYIGIKGQLQEGTKNYIEFVRQVAGGPQGGPDVEELGEEEVDGHKAVGFAAKGPNGEMKIWADRKTALPIRIELRLGQLFAVLKNFSFDAAVDDSLVSMDVPAGYTAEQSAVDFSGASEEDFVESLRTWAEVLGEGTFPDAIGTENSMKQVPLLGEKLALLKLPEDQAKQRAMRFIRGMLFLQIYETGDQWHYAGEGVKLGDSDTAVFWYRPKGSQSYRVIHGDLSVKDAARENLPK